MGYARNIGRIGALAVALGIGYGTTPAVGFADTGDTAGNDSASASSSAPQRQARPSRSATARGNAAGQSGASAPAAPPEIEAVPDADPAPVAHRGSDSVPTVDVTDPAPAVNNSAPVSQNVDPASAAAPAPSASVPPAMTPAMTAPPSSPAPAAAAVVEVVPAPAVSTPAATPAVTRNAPAAPLPAATTAQLVSAALAPLLGGTGGAPGQAPLLWTVMSWARREFESLIQGTKPAAVTTSGQVQSPNLLVNPGAELSDPSLSGFSAVTMPGWTVKGTPTVIEYGTERVIMPLGLPFALPDLPSIWSFPKAKNGPDDGGNQFFGGGNVADSTIAQTVDLAAASAAIDGGNVSYNLGAWLGGYSFDPSMASVKVTFLDADGKSLGTGKVGPVTMWDRLFAINLLERSTTGTLPVGTRSAQVEVEFDDRNPIKYGFAADYNDAFADNISFTVGADLPAPPPPAPTTATPPALDHVFMVYMENKGYTNIVGSPNAPYLNGLINTYGFADNYYALTHGSLPNYYPIIGGDNFGITYNCAEPCIDIPLEDTLVGQIDLAGKTWKSYAQGLTPGGDPLVSTGEYAVDETAFPAFQAIGGDPAYAKAHIVPLEQMAVDLNTGNPADTPNYVWFAADEASNGEGPVDGIEGALRFVINQLDPNHQYNVPALDKYLSDTVPVILNSKVWNDPNEKSVLVVTFDEDNMNTSLGFGNEGNHIVTVVIASPGAIAAGMKGGAFTATNQYNHYSLLHFIEGALGLPALTTNDKYAVPMTEFWDTAQTVGSGSTVV